MAEELRKQWDRNFPKRRGLAAVVDASRVPPQAVEIEQAVLGALMTDNEAAIELSGFLESQHFYHAWHAAIYESIVALVQRQVPVDLYTVHQALIDNGKIEAVGGASYLAELTLKVASSAHVVEHAKIVVEKFLLRELIRVSNEIENDSYTQTEDVQDVLETAERKIFEISQSNIRKEVKRLPTVLNDALKLIKEASKADSSIAGLSTGFPHVDELTGGWHKGEFIVIAARPSVGKTAFALNMAYNMAIKDKRKVAFFSLEMPSSSLVLRLIASETEINSKQLSSGRLTEEQWERINYAALEIAKANIFFDSTQGIGPGEIRSKCRKLKLQYDIDMVVIDYLQLITAPYSKVQNREQEISKISRSLKALALELDIPIVALSQLNRAVENRASSLYQPQLSDIRESGAIEQDADIVAFVHRPEKHKVPMYPDETPTTGMAELRIEKNRSGETGIVYLSFIASQTKFVDNLSQLDHYQQLDKALRDERNAPGTLGGGEGQGKGLRVVASEYNDGGNKKIGRAKAAEPDDSIVAGIGPYMGNPLVALQDAGDDDAPEGVEDMPF